MTEPLLSIRHLCTEFATDEGRLRAVDDVSFDLAPGGALGLVGESGCGKSVTSLSILRLIQSPGRIASGEMPIGNLMAFLAYVMQILFSVMMAKY